MYCNILQDMGCVKQKHYHLVKGVVIKEMRGIRILTTTVLKV